MGGTQIRVATVPEKRRVPFGLLSACQLGGRAPSLRDATPFSWTKPRTWGKRHSSFSSRSRVRSSTMAGEDALCTSSTTTRRTCTDAAPRSGRLADRLPGQPVRQDREPCEEAHAGYRVIGRRQLEKKRGPDRQLRGADRGAPEIGVLRSWSPGQPLVPPRIRHGDEPPHGGAFYLACLGSTAQFGTTGSTRSAPLRAPTAFASRDRSPTLPDAIRHRHFGAKQHGPNHHGAARKPGPPMKRELIGESRTR